MASEIIRGLFGFDPQQKALEQEQMDMSNAFRVAQLSPMQQASFQGLQGANMIRRGIGGAGRELFGIQDPEMKENALLEQGARELYSSGVDPLSTQGLSTLMQRLNAAGARPQTLERLSMAMSQAQMREAKLQSEQALAAQRMREGRANLPREVQIAQMLNDPNVSEEVKQSLREQIFREKAQNDPEFVKLLDARDKAAEGSSRRRELDRLIQAEIEGRGKRGQTTITNQLPGAEDVRDVPKLRKDIQETIKPQMVAYEAAEKALININEARTNDNPVALNTAIRGLAKAVDGGQISNRDVQDAGGDPSLLGRITDWASILATGLPTDKTVINIKRTIEAMQKVARRNLDTEIAAQRQLYLDAGVDAKVIDNILGGFSKTKKPSSNKQTRKTASGIEYTVEE